MGASYLTYTLLMLISFHNGHTEMVLTSGYTQEACDRQAIEDNTNWKLRGDHLTFKFVKYVCISTRKVL